MPSKLERCTDPLEQAIKFLVPLQTLCADQIQSHIFAYEIYSRKGLLVTTKSWSIHKFYDSHFDFDVIDRVVVMAPLMLFI